MTDYQEVKTEVLVIGAGGAGLRAAIEATRRKAKVLLVTKEPLGQAHTGKAMGGLNAAVKLPATPEQHYKDTIEGGWFINNHRLVHIFTREIPDRIYDLEKYGVRFDRVSDGSFYTWAGGKQSAPLNICAGDYTGREMMEGLATEAKRLSISYLDHHYVSKILTNKGLVQGAFLIDLKDGSYKVVQAKATILAAGGAGQLYLITSNEPSNTGEGYAWGLDVGAQLIDMEMIQFHPTGIAFPQKKGKLVTEKVRGHLGILRNKQRERFMKRYQPERLELAGRDEVTRAIYQEIQEGRGTKNGGVYLDVTGWESGKVEKIIPDVFAEHLEMGIDIRKQMMEVSPTMHHIMGGIKINEWGETGVKGFYACGEVAGGIHGANRLGGNSLAEGQVFGRRVGIRAAEYVGKVKAWADIAKAAATEMEQIQQIIGRKKGLEIKRLWTQLKNLMWDKVGIIRDAENLSKAKRELARLKKEALKVRVKKATELQSALELLDGIKAAQAITIAAILREESRGAHYRSDFPNIEKTWEKNIIVYQEKGKLKTKVIPVK